jgi:MOSC domain-containing protein YiiM
LISLLAGDRESWKWAGDQLFIHMDLSISNLPPGTRLKLGSALIEITSKPHTGCSKFAGRYGKDALEFVNSPEGKQLRLRGLYAKVVERGTIRVGDVVTKV